MIQAANKHHLCPARDGLLLYVGVTGGGGDVVWPTVGVGRSPASRQLKKGELDPVVAHYLLSHVFFSIFRFTEREYVISIGTIMSPNQSTELFDFSVAESNMELFDTLLRVTYEHPAAERILFAAFASSVGKGGPSGMLLENWIRIVA